MGSSTATIPFPRTRLSTVPVTRLGARHHTSVALLEVDVTKARRRTVPQGSGATALLSWLVSQIAVSIRNHPEVHSGGRRRGPKSDSVHVRVMIERLLEQRRIGLPLLVAHADSRTAEEIAEQLDAARQEPVDAAEVVFGPRANILRRILSRPFHALPRSIRAAITGKAIAAGRHLRTRDDLPGRTITVASLGPGARVRGWYVPRAREPVAIGVGAVAQKAAVINGRIEPREMLHLSVLLQASADDDASRWLSSLIKGMEGAFSAESVT